MLTLAPHTRSAGGKPQVGKEETITARARSASTARAARLASPRALSDCTVAWRTCKHGHDCTRQDDTYSNDTVLYAMPTVQAMPTVDYAYHGDTYY